MKCMIYEEEKTMPTQTITLLIKRIAEAKNLSAEQKITLITNLSKPGINTGG